jgi:galactonate dehydratase
VALVPAAVRGVRRMAHHLICEGIEKWRGFYDEILVEPFRWEDGFIIPPSKPGLGIELREDVMLKNAYRGNRPAIDISYNSVYEDYP